MRFSTVEVASTASSMQNQSLIESLQEQEARAEQFQYTALRLEEELAQHKQDKARLRHEIVHYDEKLSHKQKLDGQCAALHFEEEVVRRLQDEALQYKKEWSSQEDLSEQTHRKLMESENAALLHFRVQQRQKVEEMQTIQKLNKQVSLYEQVLHDNIQDQHVLQKECEQYATHLLRANEATHKAEAQAAALVEVGRMAEAQIESARTERHELGLWANNQHAQNVAWLQRLREANEVRNRRFTELEECVQARDERAHVLRQEYNATERYLKAQEQLNLQFQFMARHEFVECQERKNELLNELHAANLKVTTAGKDMDVQTDETQFEKPSFKAPPTNVRTLQSPASSSQSPPPPQA